MPTLIFTILVLHIIAGNLALISGAFAMISKKGQKVHRKSGKIFFFSMLAVCFSAIFISIAKSSDFLLLVGIFVFYQAYSGWRSVKNKSLQPNWLDYVISVMALINAIFMVTSGAIVLIVFGAITFLLVALDKKIFSALLRKKEISRLAWLSRHIGMMVGAYTGTITAFLVVNVQQIGPAWMLWLAPTVVLVPLMQFWQWKYTRKPLLARSQK